jgi:hypothetical protein
MCLLRRVGLQIQVTHNSMPETKGVGGVPREARSEQNEEAVIQIFEEYGTFRIRNVGKLCPARDWEILKCIKLNQHFKMH